jgi:hypothetical protein
MIKLLKEILNEEGQDLKRLALVAPLLALGTLCTQYLAHRSSLAPGLPHFTVRASR